MDKPSKPEAKPQGEPAKGKYHYDPVGMAGKSEGAEGDPGKPKGHDATTHRRDEDEPRQS